MHPLCTLLEGPYPSMGPHIHCVWHRVPVCMWHMSHFAPMLPTFIYYIVNMIYTHSCHTLLHHSYNHNLLLISIQGHSYPFDTFLLIHLILFTLFTILTHFWHSDSVSDSVFGQCFGCLGCILNMFWSQFGVWLFFLKWCCHKGSSTFSIYHLLHISGVSPRIPIR